MQNATDLEWADQYAGKLRDELVDKSHELIAIADELRIVVNWAATSTSRSPGSTRSVDRWLPARRLHAVSA